MKTVDLFRRIPAAAAGACRIGMLTILFIILVLSAGSGQTAAKDATDPWSHPSAAVRKMTDRSSPGLPAPTGRFPLGTTEIYLVDRSRKDTAAGDGQYRELVMQLWYPTATRKKFDLAPYLKNPHLLPALKKERYLNLGADILDSWSQLKTHSRLNSPPTGQKERFPLLVFSPGFGMTRANYTLIFEELASRGYIVAAIDHPYAGLTIMPDGRVLSNSADRRGPEAAAERVEAIAGDIVFAIRELLKNDPQMFFGRPIDEEKIGVFGHSLGGAAALETCRISRLVRACADLDGTAFGKVATEGVGRPFLVMLNVPAKGHRPPPEMARQRDAEWEKIITAKKTTAYIVKVEGTFHYSFTDLPLIVPAELFRKNGADLDPERGLQIITRILNEFFEIHLKNKKSADLRALAKNYDEVELKDFHR